MLTPFERGLVAHLVADWVLQTDWMVCNKTSLFHPAAWIHAGIQTLAISFAIGWEGGIVLGIIHLLIDLRIPLQWWIRVVKRTTGEPMGLHVFLWTDQVLHILALALWLEYLAPLLK